MKSTQCDVLIVEDQTADLELALRALKKGGITDRIDVARDGVEALDFIFCRGAHWARNAAHAPHVILLDLKLPKVGGFEILQQMKGDPRTCSIPVVVLTASRERRDMDAIRSLGIEGYIVKPGDFMGLAETVRTASKGAISRDASLALPFHGGTETILVVEDDVILGAEVQAYLTRIGYSVLFADCARIALEIWNEHDGSIDLLLTDIDMPGEMDGTQLACHVAADEPELPIVYLSSSKDFIGRNPDVQEGVNFLSKPCAMPSVARTIRERLDLRIATGH